MIRWLTVALRLALAGLKSHRNLLLENLALRHQLLVLSRGSNRPRFTPMDRALWAWLSCTWDGWHGHVASVAISDRPQTRGIPHLVTGTGFRCREPPGRDLQF